MISEVTRKRQNGCAI